jgi:predicted Zn-dependent protease
VKGRVSKQLHSRPYQFEFLQGESNRQRTAGIVQGYSAATNACNLYGAGQHSKDDIISNVDYGVYVDNFSNGQVQIGAGDFTFFVKSGYLIEKGKLTRPIKDINIIGNGPQALADISMAANDYLIDNGTWTCGKNGQSVPVTCGLPTVLVKKLTLGDKCIDSVQSLKFKI